MNILSFKTVVNSEQLKYLEALFFAIQNLYTKAMSKCFNEEAVEIFYDITLEYIQDIKEFKILAIIN